MREYNDKDNDKFTRQRTLEEVENPEYRARASPIRKCAGITVQY